jgi:prepilin-type N-terminal cleavage/methylation domain-containing protein
MKILKILSNKSGFSLVEVMIAMGMLGIVSWGVMSMMKNMSSNVRWMEKKSEEMELIERFKIQLRDKLVCTHTLIGACSDKSFSTEAACIDASLSDSSISWTPNQVPVSNTSIIIKSRTDSDLFEAGQTYGMGSGKIEIKSILFDYLEGETAGTAGEQGEARIRLVINRNTSGASSSQTTMTQTVGEDVNLIVTWDTSNTITECYADRENTILTAKGEACETLGGLFDEGQDWCKLLEGPETGATTTKDTFTSRAIAQSYANDLFRRSCTGPGKIYVAGTSGGPPTCDVDISRLSGSCPAGQFVKRVTFKESGGTTDGNKYDPEDGDELEIECKGFCEELEFFQGFDSAGYPICFKCNIENQVPVWNGSNWACKFPHDESGTCNNTVDNGSNETLINVFDGWNNQGEVKCKTIMKFPNTACPTGQVMVGYTTSSNGTQTPNCCETTVSCPAPSTVCENGFQAPVDQCGFTCPGTKQQSTAISEQPLVYGCEYYMDSLKITRNFPEYICGPPDSTSEEENLYERSCYLGGDNSNHTYVACRAQQGTVAFFSNVDSTIQDTGLLTTGLEEDSFCLIPQTETSGTYGREGTNMAINCTNCNFVDINLDDVRTARSCPGGWSDAKDSNNNILYLVNSTFCESESLADNGGACASDGRYGDAKSHTIEAGTYLEPSGTDRAYWKYSFVEDQGDGYHTTPPNSDDAHYDSWIKDHGNTCLDGDDGVEHWDSYRCYARIGGISCK